MKTPEKYLQLIVTSLPDEFATDAFVKKECVGNIIYRLLDFAKITDSLHESWGSFYAKEKLEVTPDWLREPRNLNVFATLFRLTGQAIRYRRSDDIVETAAAESESTTNTTRHQFTFIPDHPNTWTALLFLTVDPLVFDSDAMSAFFSVKFSCDILPAEFDDRQPRDWGQDERNAFWAELLDTIRRSFSTAGVND